MTAELRLDDVRVSFGGVHAVDGVTVTFGKARCAIVGPNGAGKTTLLNAICGFASLSRGAVYLNSGEVSGQSVGSRAKLGLGRSFQHPTIVPSLTVRENLEVCAGRASRLQVDHVCDLLGVGPWLERPATALPYGVRKLIDVGRGLLVGRSWLICDEPLSGLDGTARDEMMATLRMVVHESGVSLLVVEHDVTRVAAFAEQLVVLDFGRVLADGEPSTVLNLPAVKAAYYGRVSE